MPDTIFSFPPVNPDLKRELKDQLLNMSPRAFELFAGEFLIYAGLERISVTEYQGDGGIDAEGDLVATLFRIPVGVQVKRYKKGNNVSRSDIDRFIGALTGRFSQGIFMTTANYGPKALQKATLSIPRIMTLNGDQIVSVMLIHHLGLKPSSINTQKLDIDTDYFATFEVRKLSLAQKIRETSGNYDPLAPPTQSDSFSTNQKIEVKPENDLISLN
ncbi:MAG: restriction endonuclease, partial [Ktedonobacteraceae bacterium]|nr:restriction endonuclease [Ktedonobacteraceae bacterium]